MTGTQLLMNASPHNAMFAFLKCTIVVAVGMCARRMIEMNLLAAQMEDQLAVVGDGRRRLHGIEVEALLRALVALQDSVPDVFLRVDRPELREHGIAACVIAVMVRVDDEAYGLAS